MIFFSCFSIPHRNFSVARSLCLPLSLAPYFLPFVNWWFFVIAHGYKCPIHQKSTIVACFSLSSSSFFALFLNAYYLVLWIGFFGNLALFTLICTILCVRVCLCVFTWFFRLSLCLCCCRFFYLFCSFAFRIDRPIESSLLYRINNAHFIPHSINSTM